MNKQFILKNIMLLLMLFPLLANAAGSGPKASMGGDAPSDGSAVASGSQIASAANATTYSDGSPCNRQASIRLEGACVLDNTGSDKNDDEQNHYRGGDTRWCVDSVAEVTHTITMLAGNAHPVYNNNTKQEYSSLTACYAEVWAYKGQHGEVEDTRVFKVQQIFQWLNGAPAAGDYLPNADPIDITAKTTTADANTSNRIDVATVGGERELDYEVTAEPGICEINKDSQTLSVKPLGEEGTCKIKVGYWSDSENLAPVSEELTFEFKWPPPTLDLEVRSSDVYTYAEANNGVPVAVITELVKKGETTYPEPSLDFVSNAADCSHSDTLVVEDENGAKIHNYLFTCANPSGVTEVKFSVEDTESNLSKSETVTIQFDDNQEMFIETDVPNEAFANMYFNISATPVDANGSTVEDALVEIAVDENGACILQGTEPDEDDEEETGNAEWSLYAAGSIGSQCEITFSSAGGEGFSKPEDVTVTVTIVKREQYITILQQPSNVPPVEDFTVEAQLSDYNEDGSAELKASIESGSNCEFAPPQEGEDGLVANPYYDEDTGVLTAEVEAGINGVCEIKYYTIENEVFRSEAVSARTRIVIANVGAEIQDQWVPHKLAVTKENQAITAAPMVSRSGSMKGGYPNTVVMFGTGRYLTSPDLRSVDQQSIYAVRDESWNKNRPGILNEDPENPAHTITGKRISQITTADLTERTLKTIIHDNEVYRYIEEDTAVDWNGSAGWYFDLAKPNAQRQYGSDYGHSKGGAERAVYRPVVMGSSLMFSTMIPNVEMSCSSSTAGGLLEINWVTGLASVKPVFDSSALAEFGDEAGQLGLGGLVGKMTGSISQLSYYGKNILYSEDGDVRSSSIAADQDCTDCEGTRVGWEERHPSGIITH